jgi:hypothetical protein
MRDTRYEMLAKAEKDIRLRAFEPPRAQRAQRKVRGMVKMGYFASGRSVFICWFGK